LRFPGNTKVRDIDVVVAGRQVVARLIPFRNVVASGGVRLQRAPAGGSVEVAGRVEIERIDPGGGIVVAGCVVKERAASAERL
jgi:hypothetical protein